MSGLLRSRVKGFISYPQYDKELASKRRKELADFGVKSIIQDGKHTIDGIHILGKGHTGIVLKALYNDNSVALKILRADADRSNLIEETRLLKLANSVGVGPRFIAVSDSFLLMELVEGVYLRDWINKMTDKETVEFQTIMGRLLLDAYRLDSIGLDHGELVRLRRHIIYTGERPVIIDFESASTNRHPSNLTTVVQSIYLNSKVSDQLAKTIKHPPRVELLKVLKEYKKDRSLSNLEKISETIGVPIPN